LTERDPGVKVGMVGVEPRDGLEAAPKEGEVGIGRVEVTVGDKTVDKLLTVAWAKRHSEACLVSSTDPGLSKGIKLAAGAVGQTAWIGEPGCAIVGPDAVHGAVGRGDLDVGGAVGDVAIGPGEGSGLKNLREEVVGFKSRAEEGLDSLPWIRLMRGWKISKGSENRGRTSALKSTHFDGVCSIFIKDSSGASSETASLCECDFCPQPFTHIAHSGRC
jgi:hypothetical protein